MEPASEAAATRARSCRARYCGAFAALALASACGEAAQGEPTFAGDVAGIVYTSCTPCHRTGERTPFTLLGYDDVYKRRDKIADAVRSRLMPPWLPSHGDFADDRRLSEKQSALLLRWIEAGAPRGDAASEPKRPEFPAGWQLREPDLVVTGQEVVVPESGPDQFRNLVIPVAITAQKFVAAIEVRPGNPAVHHAVVAVDATGRCRQLDARDAEAGFAGMSMGNAKPPDGCFLGWTPGKRVHESAPGMAWRLAPGSDLVLQLHLAPTGRRETVRPQIGLYFTDVPPAVITYPLCLSAKDIDLPPGASDVVVRDAFVLPVPVEVHSVYPHAHYLCRRMEAWATLPGGERRELFSIERWDFDWQDDYRYRKPMPLPAGARVEFAYHYDNSAGNPANPSSPPRHVRLGDRSIDEMGNLTLQVTVQNVEARRAIGEAGVRRELQRVGFDAALMLELTTLLRESGRHDEALATVTAVREREPENVDALLEQGHCLAGAGRIDEAGRAYEDCLRRDPALNVARMQRAMLWLRQERYAEAIAVFDQALPLSPDFAPLHYNLAQACMGAGKLDRAEHHYRRAVAIDPALFPGWFHLGRVLAAAGRTADAREALLRAQALRPEDPRPQEVLRQLGR
ncbi:MAG TPA: tetratricopeptide repeat protein [Planctomycetota bacterium]